MVYDYSALQAKALELITRFGYDMTFNAAGTAGDPVTGLGGAAGASRTLKGVEVKVSQKDFPSTVIEATDKALLVEGASILKSDKWGEWRIVEISPIQPNGSDVLAVKLLVRS